jgi:hypothetical protein
MIDYGCLNTNWGPIKTRPPHVCDYFTPNGLSLDYLGPFDDTSGAKLTIYTYIHATIPLIAFHFGYEVWGLLKEQGLQPMHTVDGHHVLILV